MSLQIGIVGLPNVGKSTLFNALTRSRGAEAANYPFCTIDPNVGVVEVPDERLQKLAEIVKPQKILPTAIEFVDIAGLVAGASKGEGLGNQFLAHIRECDAIAQVVRVFEDSDVTHVAETIDAKRDREIVETELQLADLQTVEKRLEKTKNAAKSGDKKLIIEAAFLEKLFNALGEGKMARTVMPESDDEKEIAKSLHLITAKPIIYVVNLAEDKLKDFDSEAAKSNLELESGTEAVGVSAKIEAELIELTPEEAKEFLTDLGVQSSGLDQLIQVAYKILNLRTFFTAGEKEVRAWTIRAGDLAPQAAGVIHSDFEKSFIRAEAVSVADFVAHGGWSGAREKGLVRSEGKEYEVQEGDVCLFKTGA